MAAVCQRPNTTIYYVTIQWELSGHQRMFVSHKMHINVLCKWLNDVFFSLYSQRCDKYRLDCRNTLSCGFPSLRCTSGSWGITRCSISRICRNRRVCRTVTVKQCCRGYSGDDCSGCELETKYWHHSAISLVQAIVSCVYATSSAFFSTMCCRLLCPKLCEW